MSNLAKRLARLEANRPNRGPRPADTLSPEERDAIARLQGGPELLAAMDAEPRDASPAGVLIKAIPVHPVDGPREPGYWYAAPDGGRAFWARWKDLDPVPGGDAHCHA